jgi:cysteine synthase A
VNVNGRAISIAIPDSVLDLIGNTPILELRRIRELLELDGRLLAKLEHLNPGGSKKDRVALSMIQAARADGRLIYGQPVVEVTSGNTGTGLAIVCRALGHPFYAVMSSGNTRERAQMIRAFGGKVVLVEQAPSSEAGRVTGQDMRLVKERAALLVSELNAFFVDQFENPANPLAHELQTSTELWRQSGGKLDAIVAFVGSGGALAGLVRGLRKWNRELRVYVVEPAAAASLSSGCCSDAGHAIQGGGYGRDRLTLLEGLRIDGHFSCTDREATVAARLLASEAGVLAGYSTGAQLHVACELLRSQEKGNSIAFLVCDTGMKYLSTELYP